VLYTWIQAAALLGFTVHVASPEGYGIDATRVSGEETRHVRAFDDPMDACRDADLVTTDVWTSMGFEAENDARKAASPTGWSTRR
jgi:ornithine carbamoyltransferase